MGTKEEFFDAPIQFLVEHAKLSPDYAKRWYELAASGTPPKQHRNPVLKQALGWVHQRRQLLKQEQENSPEALLARRLRDEEDQRRAEYTREQEELQQQRLIVAQQATAIRIEHGAKTFKAAKEAGFRERRDREYGGEQIEVKGRVFARNCSEAVSATEWKRRGYIVESGAVPHATVSGQVGGGAKSAKWSVYREDQVTRMASKPTLH